MERFEALRESFSDDICTQYDEAMTYRDGKWIMFTPENAGQFSDYIKLLSIKRKPNKK